MGTTQSTHQRSNSFSGTIPHHKSSFLDAGCLGCFPNPDRLDFNIDNAELQTHNKELVPKGKVSQASIAYLSKEEIGFLKACSGKNISALRYYMNKGTNVNLLDEDRTSPLHVACRSGSLQVVEELINWGAAVNIADMAGWTSLHIAAYHQRPLICHLLLKKGADPYLISRNGETPWDLVKDKNTEEIFYVHFDRNDLKKMGKLKKDEPPGEIGDENIWVNQLEVKDRAFQNKLGVDLRRGGIIEEEKSVDYFFASKFNNEPLPTESNMLTSTQYLSMAPESTRRTNYLTTNRTIPFRNSENEPKESVKRSIRDRKENIPRNKSNYFLFSK